MSAYLRNECRQSALPIGCSFLLGLVLLTIYVHSKNAVKSKAITERHRTHRNAVNVTLTDESERPLCVGGILENKRFHYEKKPAGVFGSDRSELKPRACRILQYKTAQTVACLDALNDLVTKTHNRPRGLHFLFIGDSRIRQQFFNFVRLIPQYDKKSKPTIVPDNYHNDIEVTSDLLRLRIFFKWRPLLDHTVTETIRHLLISNEIDRPYFILLGMTTWHMLQSEGANYQLYRTKLLNLAPVLDQLANDSQVIWLNQYPSIDFNKETGVFKTDGIASEKIHHYNEITRNIFANHTNIRIWDSSNLFAEEYVRGCAILERDEQSSPFRRCPSVQFNCNDFLHTGDVALTQATQLLMNDVCNILPE